MSKLDVGELLGECVTIYDVGTWMIGRRGIQKVSEGLYGEIHDMLGELGGFVEQRVLRVGRVKLLYAEGQSRGWLDVEDGLYVRLLLEGDGHGILPSSQAVLSI